MPFPAAEPAAPAPSLLGLALETTIVPGVLGVYTLVLYWQSFSAGVTADGWHLLYIGSQPFWEALSTRLSYHFIPGTHLLDAILWRVLGLRDGFYQVVNLIELWLVGVGLYALGRQLFGRASVPLLASLLFLANASFHEVSFWAGVGNFHSLTALLYLAGIGAAVQAGRSPRPLAWSLLFALFGLAAFFTYEPAFSLLPVGVLAAALLAGDVPPGEGWRARIRFWIRRGRVPLIAAAIAVAIVLAVKYRLTTVGDRAMLLPETFTDVAVRLLFWVREVLHLLLLRADASAVQRVFDAGTGIMFGQPLFYAVMVGWFLLFAATGIVLVLRGGPAVRLLTLWFAIHTVLVAISVIPQSRHYYLAALPLALLSAALLWAGAERAAAWLRRWPSADWAAQPAFLALFVLLLLVPGAKGDLNHAAELYGQATAASRQIRAVVQERLTYHPALASVVLVNLPAQEMEHGLSVYFFINGVHQMIELSTGGAVKAGQVRLFHMDTSAPFGTYANNSQPVTTAQLDAAVRDRSALVLVYDPRSRTFTRAQASTWQTPRVYARETTPYLPWSEPPVPSLRVAGDRPLGLLLARDVERPWVALRFLRSPEADLDVTWEANHLAFERRPVEQPYWSVATFDAGASAWPLRVDLRTRSETRLAGAWVFSPPTAYSPETVPFLSWWEWDDLLLSIEEPLALPLDTRGCAPGCAVRLEYSAEPGRGFSVRVNEGEARSIETRPGELAGWIEVLLPVAPGTDTAAVRIEPTGPLPVRLRTLERVAPPGP